MVFEGLDTFQKSAINSLFADPEFQTLAKWNHHINSFHLSSVHETDHSQMIRWILQPGESHGFGTSALKALMHECWVALKESKIEEGSLVSGVTITPIALEQMTLESTFSKVEFVIEQGRIDIILVCATEQLAIVIENKYGACETKGQLKKYKAWGEKHLTNYQVFYVYMDYEEKWDGVNGSSDWICVSYGWLEDFLESNLLNINHNDRVSYLLTDYLNYIRSDDLEYEAHYSGVKKSVHSLFSKHREAVELLDRLDFSSMLWDSSRINDLVQPSEEGMLLNLYHRNEDAIDLLLEWDDYYEIVDLFSEKHSEVEVETGAKYINFHHLKWAQFQVEPDGLWGIYLNLRLVDGEVGVGELPRYKLTLRFYSVNFDNNKWSLLSTVWESLSGRSLSASPGSKNKSIALGLYTLENKESLATKIVDEINNVNSLLS